MKTEVPVFKLIDLDGGHPMLYGTINDVRQFAKNLWKQDSEFVQDILYDNFEGNLVEEDFYTKMDDDGWLLSFLVGGGYHLEELCEVPLDDFYDEEKPSQELIDEVLEQIKKDVAGGDVTAIEELLMHVPLSKLGGYLPE
jgi:hypothetical protein